MRKGERWKRGQEVRVDFDIGISSHGAVSQRACPYRSSMVMILGRAVQLSLVPIGCEPCRDGTTVTQRGILHIPGTRRSTFRCKVSRALSCMSASRVLGLNSSKHRIPWIVVNSPRTVGLRGHGEYNPRYVRRVFHKFLFRISNS